MEYFSYDHIAVAVVVIVAALGVYNLAVSAWQNHKKIHQPEQEREDTVMSYLRSDKLRIERLEQQLDEQAEATKLMLKSMMQLMNHEIDGNHTEKLVEMRDRLNDYLVEK